MCKYKCGTQLVRRSSKNLTWLGLLIMLIWMSTPVMAADWAAVNDMTYGHDKGNAVRLNDGRVMVQGEIYDPASGAWSATSMATSAYLSTATLLMDGRVLQAGHFDLFNQVSTSNAQIYNPAINSWTETTPSNFGHGGHVAVRLSDGRVLVAGNRDGGSAAEIFDPNSETWSNAGNMNTGHVDGFIELLPNGKVMVGGGGGGVYFGPAVAGIEIYDPASNTWTSMVNQPGLWRYPSSTALADGRVLVVAGDQSFLYDSNNNSWTQAANLNVVHWGGFSVTRLADDQVLAAGGTDASTYIGNAAEIYNPATNTWARISDMPENRGDHASALLDTGHVLLAGGTHSLPTCCGIISAVLYTPSGTTTPPVTPPPPPPATPTPIHIADIDNVSGGGTLQWVPQVSFTVFDDNNLIVGGALVTGVWSNGLSGSASCSTVNDGTCIISNLTLPKIADVPNPLFTVTDVSRIDTVYDAAANTDPDGDSDGTNIVVVAPAAPPPAPSPSTASISDLDGRGTRVSRRRWQATVNITAKDDLGNRVSNAVVTGNWSGGFSGSDSCTTNSNGMCSVISGDIRNKKSNASFTVGSISHATLTYEASANSDPDGDSNGTTIQVNKP